VKFNEVIFSSVFARDTNFFEINWFESDFSWTLPNGSNFFNVKFSKIDFSFARFLLNNFTNVQFDDIILLNNNFVGTIFSLSDLSNLNFSKNDCGSVRFNNVNLSNLTFSQANLRQSHFINIDLKNVNFTGANLCKAEFTNTFITDYQLKSAQSIRAARLSNGTIGQGKNLILKGYAHCNISLNDTWQINHGIVILVPIDKLSNHCRFTLYSDTIGGIISQRINLTNFWNSAYSAKPYATLIGHMTNDVFIQLKGLGNNDNIFDQKILSKSIIEINYLYENTYFLNRIKSQ
jgi:uncharacterized protein YjbI with pentapeptide repeats